MDLKAVRGALYLCRKDSLQSICELFELRRYGSKIDMVTRIASFAETASADERNQLTQILGEMSPGNTPKSSSHSSMSTFSICPSRTETESRPLGAQTPGMHLRGSGPPADMCASFANIDPFHPIADIAKPFIFWTECRGGSSSFPVDLPDWKAMRRQGYSVWLRGISKTAGKNERQVWPKQLGVFANLTQVARVEEPKRLKKRRDEPIDLTAFLQTGKNHVQISVNEPRPANFTVALIVCRSVSNSAILNSISEQSFETSKAWTREIIDVKSEILVDEGVDGCRRMDLRCPVSLDKIKTAGRGVRCRHLRCFDLKAFIDVNRHTSNINLRWLCPICYEQVPPQKLVKDAYVQAILENTSENETEVLINIDTCEFTKIDVDTASLQPQPDEEEDKNFPPERYTNKPDVIEVDLDDDEDVQPPPPKFIRTEPGSRLQPMLPINHDDKNPPSTVRVMRPFERVHQAPPNFEAPRTPLRIMRPPQKIPPAAPANNPEPDIIELD